MHSPGSGVTSWPSTTSFAHMPATRTPAPASSWWRWLACTGSQRGKGTRMSRLEELVAAAARRFPDAVAVVDGSRQLTYRELASATTAVRTGLQARGVVPGDRVAVTMRRRADFVPVVLGVLGAGAAFVPSDARTPRH